MENNKQQPDKEFIFVGSAKARGKTFEIVFYPDTEGLDHYYITGKSGRKYAVLKMIPRKEPGKYGEEFNLIIEREKGK